MDKTKAFKDAKFGMMIHFGLYSLLAGEYKGRRTDFISEWSQSYFRIPIREYEKLLPAFNPIYLNTDEWVRTAEDAGMKYIVLTSKHHDGFALFHSKADGFNVQATPFKRDIVAELAESCYKRGMKLGLYYSQALDWHERDGGGYDYTGPKEKGCEPTNDWDFPDASVKDYSRYFECKVKPQVKEILTQYGDLFLIWFDIPMSINRAQSVELRDMVRKYQPNCMINSRLFDLSGAGNMDLYDYCSGGDNLIPEDAQTIPYEAPATLNDTWGYKAHDQNWKTPEQILKTKAHLNERGINYLLNVGPDHLGRIPAESIRILEAVGKQK